MNLKDVLATVDYRISNGDLSHDINFCEEAKVLEFCDTQRRPYAHCKFDPATRSVLQLSLEVPHEDVCFLWLDDSFKESFYQYCEDLNRDPSKAWDDINYTHVDTEELILEYLRDIGNCDYSNIQMLINKENNDLPEQELPEQEFEETFNSFKVSLDLRLEFEIKATDFNEAVNKAIKFQKTMPQGWGQCKDDVYWIDSRIVKHIVEQELE